jgi:hypothetical protein
MKSRILVLSIIAALFLSINTIAQESKNYFYKTLEDFQTDHPMPGYEIEAGSWHMLLGKESANVVSSSGSDKTPVSKFPSDLFTYGEFFMRGAENKVWIVLAVGKYCYYAQKSDNTKQAYSETLHGEMETFRSSKFEKLLEEHGLLDQYKDDKIKREKTDSSNDIFNKNVQRNIKYFNMMNEKK